MTQTNALDQFERLRAAHTDAVLDTIQAVLQRAGLTGSSLDSMLAYHLRTGGKRLRAILPLMVAEALGQEAASLIPFGAACELIHNATLIHDDLQDGDELRRGQPAIWKEFGQARAINLGDACLYLAPLCLDDLPVPEASRWRAGRRIFLDILQVIDGQEREFDLQADATVDLSTYRRMVEGKTSGLFALPVAGAAELCDAEEALVQALEVACRSLGVLFQVQDDILDLYGDKGRDARGGDIKEGKRSALVVAFNGLAAPDDRRRLQEILDTPRDQTSEEMVAWAIDALRDQGALASALGLIDDCKLEVAELSALQDYPTLRDLLLGLAELFLRPIQGLIQTSEHAP